MLQLPLNLHLYFLSVTVVKLEKPNLLLLFYYYYSLKNTEKKRRMEGRNRRQNSFPLPHHHTQGIGFEDLPFFDPFNSDIIRKIILKNIKN
jgi:hypothetical protein